MTFNLLWGILLICVGVALLGFWVFTFFRQRARQKQWIEAVGVVAEIEQIKQTGKYIRTKTKDGWKLEPKYDYRPRIRFKPQKGRTVDFTANIWQRPNPYKVGDEVNLLYNPDNPHQSFIKGFWYLWFSTVMLTFFGGFSIGMGFLSLILSII